MRLFKKFYLTLYTHYNIKIKNKFFLLKFSNFLIFFSSKIDYFRRSLRVTMLIDDLILYGKIVTSQLYRHHCPFIHGRLRKS